MNITEYVTEVQKQVAVAIVKGLDAFREGLLLEAGVQGGRAEALKEAALLAESVDVPTWRDVTPDAPAEGIPVVVDAGTGFITAYRHSGRWSGCADDKQIDAPLRYFEIPDDEVPHG